MTASPRNHDAHSVQARPPRRPAPQRRCGLGLPELLVSLTITSMLLLSVATAFIASASSVEVNCNFFTATQAARITMTQVLNEVRCCASVQVSSGQLTIVRPAQTLTPNEVSRTYAYTGGTTSPAYTMASNVTSATFGADMGQDSNNASVIVQVPVSIGVQVGTSQVTLDGSAAPRRSLR
jgi:type II secretory pathway pseudopilin PulG